MKLTKDDLELLKSWFFGLEDTDMEDHELYERISLEFENAN